MTGTKKCPGALPRAPRDAIRSWDCRPTQRNAPGRWRAPRGQSFTIHNLFWLLSRPASRKLAGTAISETGLTSARRFLADSVDENDNIIARERRRALFLDREVGIAPARHANDDIMTRSRTEGCASKRVTVHIPPPWRRSRRATIQATAMAGIGGEGRLARAAAMSVQA